MKIHEKELLEILKFSLVNEEDKYIIAENINIIEVLKEARVQGLLSLVYNTINKDCFNKVEKDKEYIEIKQGIFFQNTSQIFKVNSAMLLIKELNEVIEKPIILKGKQIMEYYPRAEFRTMGDMDILIEKKDYPKVKEFLLQRGFTYKDETHKIHTEFSSPNNVRIEVHWDAINGDYLNFNKDNFEKLLKETAVEKDYYKYLELNNLLVYLFIHMAIHARHSGFGLRHIYDVALIIKKEQNIDWEYILKTSEELGIKVFVISIISFIKDYFGIRSNIKEEYIKDLDLLVENLFLSGVHGKKNENPDYTILSRYGGKYEHRSFMVRLFRLLFPHRIKLGEEYKYTYKHPITIPYACFHYHKTKGLMKKYSFVENIKNIKEAKVLGKKRRQLVKKLDL